ncbi:hypothetical protein ANN_25915 [Periplaneta americana]|uniref:Rab3-GAP regulatory subunit N-terminal domain-containing protein n=1 Tax=Periplaneta americana TaxID=6978 RepID=A0ABQ8S4F7_PERAM|nr:hypothetical protein ANN_25915 [Periplaneta americana]
MGTAKKSNSVEKIKEKIPVEPAVAMGCRFGLCDLLRNGDRLVISPSRNLSVVSDSLGRVILIDNLKGVAVRMWKGVAYNSVDVSLSVKGTGNFIHILEDREMVEEGQLLAIDDHFLHLQVLCNRHITAVEVRNRLE